MSGVSRRIGGSTADKASKRLSRSMDNLEGILETLEKSGSNFSHLTDPSSKKNETKGSDVELLKKQFEENLKRVNEKPTVVRHKSPSLSYSKSFSFFSRNKPVVVKSREWHRSKNPKQKTNHSVTDGNVSSSKAFADKSQSDDQFVQTRKTGIRDGLTRRREGILYKEGSAKSVDESSTPSPGDLKQAPDFTRSTTIFNKFEVKQNVDCNVPIVDPKEIKPGSVQNRIATYESTAEREKRFKSQEATAEKGKVVKVNKTSPPCQPRFSTFGKSSTLQLPKSHDQCSIIKETQKSQSHNQVEAPSSKSEERTIKNISEICKDETKEPAINAGVVKGEQNETRASNVIVRDPQAPPVPPRTTSSSDSSKSEEKHINRPSNLNLPVNKPIDVSSTGFELQEPMNPAGLDKQATTSSTGESSQSNEIPKLGPSEPNQIDVKPKSSPPKRQFRRSKSKPAGILLPRTENSIFSFGSDFDEQRISIVRDSIRYSSDGTLLIVPPPGYTELYEKATGFIIYHDNMTDTSWYTDKDDDGRLFYYTNDGRSEWTLPPVPSALGPAISQTPPDSPSIEKPKSIQKLEQVKSGFVLRRFGPNVKTPTSPMRKNKGVWEHIYLVLSNSYLLCFQEELSFQRMGMDITSLPDYCIDLSHCSLTWKNIGKRPKDSTIRLKSYLSDLDVYFSWEASKEAKTWFDAINLYIIDHDQDLLSVSSPTPSTPSFTRQNLTDDTISVKSAPASPHLLPKSNKMKSSSFRIRQDSPNRVMQISNPSDFVKASHSDLMEKLKQITKSRMVWVENPRYYFDENLSTQILMSEALKLFCPDVAPTDVKWVDNPNYQIEEHVQSELQRIKSVRKVNRNQGGLTQSFRKMMGSGFYKQEKSPTSPDENLSIGRVSNKRSKFLIKFFEKDKRISREQLIEQGIYKPEPVFGNDLSNISFDPDTGVPEFLVRCIAKIETMKKTVGIYRVNGDAAQVQKLRMEINNDNYDTLDNTKDVSLLASTLKLFFRELPEPIITKEVRNQLHLVANEQDKEKVAAACQKSLELLDPCTARVLRFLLIHLDKVSREPENKMSARNLATVFSPNLVHSMPGTRRPESLISEMELNNIVVELLIDNVPQIYI